MTKAESEFRSPASLPGGLLPRHGKPELTFRVVSAALVDLLILSICTLSVFFLFFPLLGCLSVLPGPPKNIHDQESKQSP